MAGIFVSYRRSDTTGYAGRLVDELERQFPGHQLFRDVESIEAGSDFVEAIDRALQASSALLVLIGPRWLDAVDAKGKRRLEDARDFVRLEIAAALQSGVKVIPVLVDGAQMPAEEKLPADIQRLARRQAHELTDRRWDYDVDQLFDQLGRIQGIERERPEGAEIPAARRAPTPASGTWLKVGAGALATVVGLGVFGFFSDSPSTPATAMSSPQGLAVEAAQPVAAPQPAVPQAATPASAPEPTRLVEPVAQRVAAQLPAPSTTLPNVAGLWRSTQGDGIYFEQDRQEVAVLAGDASANHGFIGGGTIQGRQVVLALTHLQSGAPIRMELDVSPDGQRMTGVGTVAGNGHQERIILVRQ